MKCIVIEKDGNPETLDPVSYSLLLVNHVPEQREEHR